MKNYSLASCEKLINWYLAKGGQLTQIEEGCLGLGHIVLHGASGLKTIIIKEFFINEWNSGHNVRMYKSMPKKYHRLTDEA